ncbi:MBL fold metallo-hydrolase [Longimicrobium terrae]|uniref:Glyoxylase-like metal-dependent hydrolase (Beta-lactamase superfamily II) n=1 Tax=Longimicrobium terrae TaxID=1639882 RepID=A0A841H712_9BACT|nr:MBL fold metallo-hydrolase [Longimicrobium terrae]MBB4639426.1 glyoxylase-like metal-dependent hydrolase (beta-lactamase superfamily II) [Longimicrobium terrae]MBB6073733.1 glyoxylase-like metal-dependent hydrolase (beta-lactamase superfamily II) [Longimicrobium terrae]NNC30675.1 MBL fold metallo-hydrolase [Longimicrobium terrae]
MADEAVAGDVTVRGFAGGVFSQNTYLLSCAGTGAGILVDPGAATAEALAAARAAGITIEQIVLTHAHIDHVEGLSLAKKETGAPVFLHPADAQLYQNAPTQAEWFGLRMDPLPPVDGELAHGGTVTFGDCTMAVRFAPGHAPGHVILVGDGVAVVGDVIFAGSIGRTDLPGGDLPTLMESIRQQVLTLPDETTLHTGHGGDTTVGRERRSNPFLTGVYGGGGFA